MELSMRVRVAFASVLLLPSITLAAAESVTEAEAIRLFLEQSPRARQVPLVVRSVDAALRVEARIANPEITYEVEAAAGVRDEFLTIQQGLPITGRRELLGRRAKVAAEAAGLAAESDLLADVYDLQRSFHEVLYRENVVGRLQNGAALLGGTVEILEMREREGEGSGYDVLRAEQELADLRMTAVEAEAALGAARARFGSFYDPGLSMDSARLEDRLIPAEPAPGIEEATERALAQRLDLRSMSAERERLDLERRAARRKRIPEPTLTAGWKRTWALGISDTGYVAALMVPLPIFNRGRLDTARADAEGERVELEAEILTRRIRSDVQAALSREKAARRVAQAYGEDAEGRAVELHRIARLKYDEGESGILELLDAHRTALTMQLRALAARFEAKDAEIERDRVIGNEVKP